jgi:hypothetical protein
VKAFIKRHWSNYTDAPVQDFGEFLQWCVDVVGRRKKSARRHFRYARIDVE